MSEIVVTRRIVKLGGSLLDWPELPMRLRDWLAMQPPAKTSLVVGGGPFADVIREADRIHRLGEGASHRLCIQVLRVSASMLARMMPEFGEALSPESILKDDSSSLTIIDVDALLRQDRDRSVRPLPESWEVTTDSIAARATVLLGADELVLLKSALPGPTRGLRELAHQGYVDEHFPICAKSISRIRLVNLRDDSFGEANALSPRRLPGT